MQSDAEFLGLSEGARAGEFTFTVEKHLARLDGRLYGGTAIAVSIATAELISERPAVWMTTQFVATAPHGERISVVAEVLAPGKRTNQIRVTGTSEAGEVMFASLGATGHRRTDGLTGEFEQFPTVQTPDESEVWDSWLRAFAKVLDLDSDFVLPDFPKDLGFNAVVEMRFPEIIKHPDSGPGRFCLWMRRTDRQPITPAVAAYLADMVPMSIAHALKVMVGGTSLDNTIRVGSFVESEWILVDLRPHLADGDYGHGVAHIWSEDGHLMATAGQSASLMRFDFGRLKGSS